jgi:hypothetical protein
MEGASAGQATAPRLLRPPLTSPTIFSSIYETGYKKADSVRFADDQAAEPEYSSCSP